MEKKDNVFDDTTQPNILGMREYTQYAHKFLEKIPRIE